MVIHIFASLTVAEMTSIFVIRFDLGENEKKIGVHGMERIKLVNVFSFRKKRTLWRLRDGEIYKKRKYSVLPILRNLSFFSSGLKKKLEREGKERNTCKIIITPTQNQHQQKHKRKQTYASSFIYNNY